MMHEKIELKDIENYLRESYSRSCKEIERYDLCEANLNWVHGKLEILNELLVLYFNEELKY